MMSRSAILAMNVHGRQRNHERVGRTPELRKYAVLLALGAAQRLRGHFRVRFLNERAAIAVLCAAEVDERNERAQAAPEEERVSEGHRPCLRARQRSSTESSGSSVRTRS